MIYVKGYNNPVKMACALELLSKQEAFRYICISGSIISKNSQFTCTGKKVISLVTYVAEDKSTMMALLYHGDCTSLKGKDIITLSELPNLIEQPNVDEIIIRHIIDKYSHTGNRFKISVGFDNQCCPVLEEVVDNLSGCPVVAEIGATEQEVVSGRTITPVLTMRLIRGSETIYKTSNSDLISEFLKFIDTIYGFEYAVHSFDGGSKEVTVLNSRTEILREIAKYLNKTIVLVSLNPNDIVEQYIGASGALEVCMRAQKLRVYSWKPLQKLNPMKIFCVYLTSSSIENVAREQGRAMSKNKR